MVSLSNINGKVDLQPDAQKELNKGVLSLDQNTFSQGPIKVDAGSKLRDIILCVNQDAIPPGALLKVSFRGEDHYFDLTEPNAVIQLSLTEGVDCESKDADNKMQTGRFFASGAVPVTKMREQTSPATPTPTPQAHARPENKPDAQQAGQSDQRPADEAASTPSTASKASVKPESPPSDQQTESSNSTQRTTNKAADVAAPKATATPSQQKITAKLKSNTTIQNLTDKDLEAMAAAIDEDMLSEEFDAPAEEFSPEDQAILNTLNGDPSPLNAEDQALLDEITKPAEKFDMEALDRQASAELRDSKTDIQQFLLTPRPPRPNGQATLRAITAYTPRAKDNLTKLEAWCQQGCKLLKDAQPTNDLDKIQLHQMLSSRINQWGTALAANRQRISAALNNKSTPANLKDKLKELERDYAAMHRRVADLFGTIRQAATPAGSESNAAPGPQARAKKSIGNLFGLLRR